MPRKVLIDHGKCQEDRLLTLRDAARRLNVSSFWLYKKCKAGEVPHLRIGRMIRFRETDIDIWLDSYFVMASQKAEPERREQCRSQQKSKSTERRQKNSTDG